VADDGVVDECRADEPEAGPAAGDGLLEARIVHQPGGDDDRRAGQAHRVADYGPYVDRQPELDPGGLRVAGVVPPQRTRQFDEQPLDDPGGGNAGADHGEQAVATVIPRPRVAQALQRRVRHLQDRLPDDAAILVVTGRRAEADHIGHQHGAVLARQHRQAPPPRFRRRRAGHDVEPGRTDADEGGEIGGGQGRQPPAEGGAAAEHGPAGSGYQAGRLHQQAAPGRRVTDRRGLRRARLIARSSKPDRRVHVVTPCRSGTQAAKLGTPLVIGS